MAVASTLAASVLAIAFRPRPGPVEPAVSPPCRWLAGDVDVHTAYTFVSARGEALDTALLYSPSVEEQAALADERGLDFIAITDYADMSAQSDPAYGTGGLIWIPGYEHTFKATAQLLGVSDTVGLGTTSLMDVRRVARRVRSGGGVFQIANPGDGRWPRSYGTRFAPDALEVWFAGPWSYDPGKIGKDQTLSMRFYDSFLDAGHRVSATGGANSLFRGITKLAGVGQPTTWVCAEDVTQAGVLQAITDGRTTLAHEFPTQAPLTEGESAAGSGPAAADSSEPVEDFSVPPPDTDIPFVTIEGDVDGDGDFEALLGDAVPPGTELRVGVFGGPFSVLRLVSDGSAVLDQVDVFTPTFVHELEMPEGATWIRAELFARPEDTVGGPCDVSSPRASYCDDRIGMLALTSPIYGESQSVDE